MLQLVRLAALLLSVATGSSGESTGDPEGGGLAHLGAVIHFSPDTANVKSVNDGTMQYYSNLIHPNPPSSTVLQLYPAHNIMGQNSAQFVLSPGTQMQTNVMNSMPFGPAQTVQTVLPGYTQNPLGGVSTPSPLFTPTSHKPLPMGYILPRGHVDITYDSLPSSSREPSMNYAPFHPTYQPYRPSPSASPLTYGPPKALYAIKMRPKQVYHPLKIMMPLHPYYPPYHRRPKPIKHPYYTKTMSTIPHDDPLANGYSTIQGNSIGHSGLTKAIIHDYREPQMVAEPSEYLNRGYGYRSPYSPALMEVSHNPYARIDRIEEEEEEVVSSEENENTTELPQKENQNQKMPVIIYKGVRPPVSVYQKPSDNFDKAHIVHENSKNQAYGVVEQTAASSAESRWLPINAPEGTVPAHAYRIPAPDLAGYLQQPEISSAQNHRYNNAPSPDDDIMNGMEKEEVVSAVVRVKS